MTAPSGGAAHGTDVPGEWVEAVAELLCRNGKNAYSGPTPCEEHQLLAETVLAAVLPLVAAENAALRAELSAIHATTEWQRWARAVTERDVARAEVERLRAALDIAEKNIHDIDEDRDRAEAAVRRVEALLDRGAVCCGEWGCSCRDDVRAALAGPGATT